VLLFYVLELIGHRIWETRFIDMRGVDSGLVGFNERVFLQLIVVFRTDLNLDYFKRLLIPTGAASKSGNESEGAVVLTRLSSKRHVMDDEEFSYEVILYKSTGDILEEDYVQFWGVPVGPYSFENVSGGSTNVQVFMGSHIEKLPQ
jgi:hypothetical protein